MVFLNLTGIVLGSDVNKIKKVVNLLVLGSFSLGDGDSYINR